MTDHETHPAGTADLVKRLRSNTPNMAIGHAAMRHAADRIEQLEAENKRLGDLYDDTCYYHTPDGRAQFHARKIVALEAALTRANAATAAAYEVAKGVRDSRNHFEQKAASQKSRVTRLRHRQRALISALEAIRSTTSLADAKFQANIAIGGWADENLIFDARALATPDQTAALDKLIAEAVDPLLIAAKSGLRFIENTESELGIVLGCGDGLRTAILAASKKGGA